MEKKSIQGSEIGVKGIRIVKALLCAYAVMGILLLVLALLLYRLHLDEGKVAAGVTLIYLASSFAGGFVIGKLNRTRKFLWGLTVGIVYFGLLLLISLAVYKSVQAGGSRMLTTFFLCAGGGTLGGMLS